MALVLLLEKRKVPARVRKLYKAFSKGDTTFIIPAMVLAELSYLSEKSRIDTTLSAYEHFDAHHAQCITVAMDTKQIQSAFSIKDIPELHDRIIAAAAYESGLPIITNDPVIQKSRYVEHFW
jgi:predicted nucleic acid-binding protein